MTKFYIDIGNFQNNASNLATKFMEYSNVYNVFSNYSKKNDEFWNDNLTASYIRQEELEKKEFELFADSFSKYVDNASYFASSLENLFQRNGYSGQSFKIHYNTEKLNELRRKITNALSNLDIAISNVSDNIPSSSSAYSQIMDLKSRFEKQRNMLLEYERYLNDVVNGICNLLVEVSTKNQKVSPNLIRNHNFTFSGSLVSSKTQNADLVVVDDVSIASNKIDIKGEQATSKDVEKTVVTNQERFDKHFSADIPRVTDSVLEIQTNDINVVQDNRKQVDDSMIYKNRSNIGVNNYNHSEISDYAEVLDPEVNIEVLGNLNIVEDSRNVELLNNAPGIDVAKTETFQTYDNVDTIKNSVTNIELVDGVTVSSSDKTNSNIFNDKMTSIQVDERKD